MLARQRAAKAARDEVRAAEKATRAADAAQRDKQRMAVKVSRLGRVARLRTRWLQGLQARRHVLLDRLKRESATWVTLENMTSTISEDLFSPESVDYTMFEVRPSSLSPARLLVCWRHTCALLWRYDEKKIRCVLLEPAAG